MKKINFTILCFLLCLCMYNPITTHAKEIGVNQYLTEGYTAEGIHYTIYDVPTSASPTVMSLQRAATQMYVVREIRFDGNVQPPKTWYFAERIGEHIYAGTLSLSSDQVIYNKTIATYKGYLSLVN